MSKEHKTKNKENENPFLLLGFWEFAILSTLMAVFFPFSLLFCVFFYGLETTKFIVLALLHDALKTLYAIITVLTLIVPLLGLLIYGLLNLNDS